MNPLNAQGLQSSPLTSAAAASSSQTSSSSSTEEKVSQVVSANGGGPHQAVAASSQSLAGRKLSQGAPPPVVLDLSSWELSNKDRMAQIQNAGGTVTLLKLGENSLSRELLKQIAKFCPQLKELEVKVWDWGLAKTIQVQSTLPKGVLLTNTSYGIPNRKELKRYLDYCAPFGGPTCLNLKRVRDLTQSELDELIERAPKLRRLSVGSCQLTELSAPSASVIYCRDCINLQSLNAPSASEIYCDGCINLQSLNAPNATKIYFPGCTGLQSISAPKATEVYCWNCTSLQSISAPCATRIDCDDCTGLQSLSAPNASRVDCSGCTNLQSLKVPLSAITGWKVTPQLSLERLRMGAKMPSPEEMQLLEASHPELAQKMRKLPVLTLQDLAINCALGNPQVDKTVVPPGLFIRDDVETAYLATPKSKME